MQNDVVLCSWVRVQIPGEDIASGLLVQLAKTHKKQTNSGAAIAQMSQLLA